MSKSNKYFLINQVVVEWNGSSALYASLSLLLASLAAVAFQL
jgi:hypothetical protein